jgi:ornithine cyclodeaminase/alanine dehydrogenase-like protein (mu-crystallin family)
MRTSVRESLVKRAEALGITGRALEDNQDAVQGADAIVTATTAMTPLIMRDWGKPGALIARLGSDHDLDNVVTVSANQLVVDHRE